MLRLINFANSEIFMIGTCGALVGTSRLGISVADPTRTGIGLTVALAICLVISMAFGGTSAVVLEAFGGAMFGSQWIDVIGFTILVAILMFRPTGLLGESLGQARA